MKGRGCIQSCQSGHYLDHATKSDTEVAKCMTCSSVTNVSNLAFGSLLVIVQEK